MSSTVTPTTTSAPPSVEYVRLLVIFFEKCSEYVKEKEKFAESFRYSVGNLTQLDYDRIQVDDVNCSTGAKPYCGIEVDNIHKHSRARRAVGGGRGRGSSGNNKKKDKIDSNFFAGYYYNQEPDCDGLAVNVSLKPPTNDLTLNKTLELMLSHLHNRTFDISVYDGSYLTVELILAAEKGNSFRLYTAPKPPLPDRFFPTRVMPPLETDWRPLIFTAGSIIGLVVLYVFIRLIKHSIFLRMKKFTKINSNKTTKKKLVKVQEEKKSKNPTIGRYDMTHNKLQKVDNEALRQGYDWTAPAYFPNMLTPAYRPTQLYGQHSPPRLMLDDSDGEGNSPSGTVGRASVINLDAEDEIFDDILDSDSEDSYKQKGKTSRARSTASGKSSGSGKSDTSGENNRKSSAHSISQIKMRNKVFPNEHRPPSTISKSCTLDSSV